MAGIGDQPAAIHQLDELAREYSDRPDEAPRRMLSTCNGGGGGTVGKPGCETEEPRE
jgi:hypothetical protein